MTLGLFFGCLEASSVASACSPERETGLWPPKRDGRFASMSSARSARLHARKRRHRMASVVELTELTVLSTRSAALFAEGDRLSDELDAARAAGDEERYEALLVPYHGCIASRRKIDAEAEQLVGYAPGGGPGRNGDELPDAPYNPADDAARAEWERDHDDEIKLEQRAMRGEREALIEWQVRAWQRLAREAMRGRSRCGVRSSGRPPLRRPSGGRSHRARRPRRRSAARCRAAPGRPSDANGELPQVGGCAALLGATVRRILRDVVRAALAHRDRSSGRPQ